jgi:nitrous oxidase accessory protein NosD
MRSLGTIAATLLLSVLATGTALALTRVVDGDGFGSSTNCNDPSVPAFVTIGAAIAAAAPNDIIKVCPGIYDEQVTVSKPLTIRGDNGAILKPTAMVGNTTSQTGLLLPIAAAIVVKPNAGVLANVVIESLTIDGADNGIGGCAPVLVGIFYRNASGTISKVAVKNMKLGPGLSGCQSGLGIFVQGVSPAVANVTVQDSSVNGYQKNGITGNENGTTIKVLRNVVTGSGATPDIAQNGVQIGFGAKGLAESNIITNHVYALCTSPEDCGAASTNILVNESNNITVNLNTVGTSNVNIYIVGNNGLANGNIVFNSVVFDGIALAGNGNKATSNTITNSDEAAVFVDGDNNRVESNKIKDTPIGVLKTDTSDGTVIAGNTFGNTDVLIVDPVLGPLNVSPVR